MASFIALGEIAAGCRVSLNNMKTLPTTKNLDGVLARLKP